MSAAARHVLEGALTPATDLRRLLKVVLQPQLQLSTDALGRKLFPDSSAIHPLDGVIKA